jgi:hypothetical protein
MRPCLISSYNFLCIYVVQVTKPSVPSSLLNLQGSFRTMYVCTSYARNSQDTSYLTIPLFSNLKAIVNEDSLGDEG